MISCTAGNKTPAGRSIFNDEKLRVTEISCLRLKDDEPMRFEAFSFGSIRIDGVTHDYDVVVDRGEVSQLGSLSDIVTETTERVMRLTRD